MTSYDELVSKMTLLMDILRPYCPSVDVEFSDLGEGLSVDLGTFPDDVHVDLDAACKALPSDDDLTTITVFGESLSDLGFRDLIGDGRPKLLELFVTEGHLTGSGVAVVERCPDLLALGLKFEGDPLEACRGIGKCSNLTRLTKVAPSTDFGNTLHELDSLQLLKSIDLLLGNPGNGIQVLKNLNSLESCWIETDQLEEGLISSFSDNKHITSLTLEIPNLSQNSFVELSEHSVLERLSVSKYALQRGDLASLEKLKQLRVLEIDSLELTPHVVEDIGELQQVKILSLGTDLIVPKPSVDALCGLSHLEDITAFCDLPPAQHRQLESRPTKA